MNQIVITGEEKVKKPKKKLEVKTIVLFYAISVMILGVCMISSSVYAMNKINETIEANTKPQVQVNRNDEENSLEINVHHIRGIVSLSYRWNEDEETVIEGNNRKELSETIDLLGGINILTISVTEENGQTVSYQKTYTAGNIPEIALEAVSNGVKIIASCEDVIDHITYSWDGQNKETIPVDENNYEGQINAPKGQHTLELEVVTTTGAKATKKQLVVGDTAPTVNVEATIIDDKLVFKVDAEDDEGITTIEITLNGGERQTIDVGDTKFHKDIEMVDGLNRLIVTVYNENGLTTTRRVQFNKEV